MALVLGGGEFQLVRDGALILAIFGRYVTLFCTRRLTEIAVQIHGPFASPRPAQGNLLLLYNFHRRERTAQFREKH